MTGGRILIAPSILSADFSRLPEEIRGIAEAGADWVHVDVMDGNFVPNITMGPVVVEGVRKLTGLPLDCHLMIEHPEEYAGRFCEAGADWVSVHPEAKGDVSAALAEIERRGKNPALAIKPATPLDAVEPYARRIRMLLIMTVNPGFSGQKMIVEALSKYREARDRFGSDLLLQIDGGVTVENASMVRAAGARCIVTGATFFSAKDRAAVVRALRGE
ncbi:MAG: ribulose-phosphate 3-epimerase [Planctomycetota bacterium]|nr:ribulose-phosphate 3-epimerase [Planctomycetota bacterium]